MSMTAAELYEVVKDVPRDAWPQHPDSECALEWRTDTRHSRADFWWKWQGRWASSEPCAALLFAEPCAALLFEASMTRWLGERNIVVGYCHMYEDFRPYTVENESASIWDDGASGGTRLHALAAACKAVANG